MLQGLDPCTCRRSAGGALADRCNANAAIADATLNQRLMVGVRAGAAVSLSSGANRVGQSLGFCIAVTLSTPQFAPRPQQPPPLIDQPACGLLQGRFHAGNILGQKAKTQRQHPHPQDGQD